LNSGKRTNPDWSLKMVDAKILLKMLTDIEVKIMLCKSAFEWELLAKKYSEIEEKISSFFQKEDVPQNFQSALNNVRVLLVQKKGELPPLDLSSFFK
jgi:hypothetical protein